MAPKNPSIKKSVIEEQPPEPFFTNFPDKPTYDDMWFDDPIEGEEAIRIAVTLQQKIEEKAAPIRTWLEKNIVPLLLQALSALVAHRPSNPCEYLGAYLIKNNPLNTTYPEDEPKPKPIIEEPIPKEEQAYDPCGCDRFKKQEPPQDIKEKVKEKEKEKELTPAQLAKKSVIAADVKKGSSVPDPVRESVLAKAKVGNVKK